MPTDLASTAQAAASVATGVQTTAGLGWSDIVALVGAFAWLPHIWRYFQKPKTTPIAGGQVEIGFSTLGPLFNPKIAFRVENRVALVTGIEFKLLHERGQCTTFRCSQLVEYGAQTESTSGEKAVHQRQQDVVALVLNPMSIVERKVNSRELGCLARLETLNIDLGRAIDRTRRTDPAWIDDLVRTGEYAAVAKLLEDSFVWQAGNYKVECSVHVAGQPQPAKCKFQFVLGDGSATKLKENLEIIRENFRLSYLPPDPANPQKPKDLNWFYAYVFVDDDQN